jgi:hypothetical protein
MADPFRKMTEKVRETLGATEPVDTNADGEEGEQLTEGRYVDQVDHGQDQAREQVRQAKGRRAGG